jgi:hypothetical protein
MTDNQRLLDLADTLRAQGFKVTVELVWIEVRTDDKTGHIKVTDEWDAFVVGWYETDDAEMDSCWDCEDAYEVLGSVAIILN